MLLEEIKRSQGIITKRELAEKFCITERTIIRDIKEILQENHIIMVISGRCGGYNLHFAWSTAMIAAEAITRERN